MDERVSLAMNLARLKVLDRADNWRNVSGDDRFLVLRSIHKPFFYAVLLNWLSLYFPKIRCRFELHSLPFRVRDWSRYSLHIPWFQDPVEGWSQRTFDHANRLAEGCEAHGIPVINRVDRLANAGKVRGGELMAATGIRMPRMARITDADEFRDTRLGLDLPLIVREDWGHQKPMLRADSDADVRALPVENFKRPVAVEFVDVRNSDGLYRKYRYVVAGDVGVPQTLQISKDWCVRGSPKQAAKSPELDEERVTFARSTEPNHDNLVAACAALDLDFVAFDYSFTPDGSLIVWEANPFPFLHFVPTNTEHARATTRVLAAMTKLYLNRAKLEVPAALDEVAAPY